MKKLTILFAAVMFSITAAFSQPVSDQGIIPIGITLNSILRLNVTSGGNIEYVVNTIDQYTNGIAANALYTTFFTVASSVNFDVNLYADAGTFIGVDDATHVLALDNLAYTMNTSGGAGSTLQAGTVALTAAAAPIVTSNAIPVGNAGDVIQNAFSIEWELGTGLAAAGSLLVQSVPSDRYVVNVVLELSQQ